MMTTQERTDRLNAVLSAHDLTVNHIEHGSSIDRFVIALNLDTDVNKVMRSKAAFQIALDDDKLKIFQDGASLIIEQPIKSDMVLFDDFAEGNNDLYNNLSFPMGKLQNGSCGYYRLDKAPHMLVAGSTGSGKSVFLHNVICGILSHNPNEVEFFIIDPKRGAEFGRYEKLQNVHLFKDAEAGIEILEWMTRKMETRYRQMEKMNTNQCPFHRIVIVIDELADLMLTAGKTVERYISRIAAMGRACGIHLVVATQTPRANIITGLIKANIPVRVGLRVTSKRESNIIFDVADMGAETLTNKGELIFFADGKRFRAQGAFISNDRIDQVIELTAQRLATTLPMTSPLAYPYDKQTVEPEKQPEVKKQKKLFGIFKIA